MTKIIITISTLITLTKQKQHEKEQSLNADVNYIYNMVKCCLQPHLTEQHFKIYENLLNSLIEAFL